MYVHCSFLRWLVAEAESDKSHLQQKPYAVFGLGSSSYPRFCAAADLMDSMLNGAGASRMAPVAKGAHHSCLHSIAQSLSLAHAVTCMLTAFHIHTGCSSKDQSLQRTAN